jgi:hypothetical protein
MHKLILIAGAAAMAASMPALAKNGGGPKGQAGAKAQVKTRTDTRVVSRGHARTDARASARARARTGANVDRTIDTDRDGIPDYRDRDMVRTRIDRTVDIDRDGIPDFRDRNIVRTGNNGQACPPGLANRTPACTPPGQARKMFSQGQRIPSGYDYFTRYEDIPLTLRNQYQLGTDAQYIYRDRSIYVVDPATRLVTRIIDLLN